MKFFIRNTEKLDYDFLKLIPVEMQKLFIECADENKLNAADKQTLQRLYITPKEAFLMLKDYNIYIRKETFL